jgi:acetylornithine/N-succinyldiaminopimelate aminotransferase
LLQASGGFPKASDGLEPSGRLSMRHCGLMIALEFDSFGTNKKVIDELLKVSDGLEPSGHLGVFTDWFLFAPNCLRIAPPLTISEEEIRIACDEIIKAIVKLS